MAIEGKLMTAEELLALPEDHKRHELVKGELRTMSPPGAEHGSDAHAIAFHVGRFLYENPIACVVAAETGFRLSRRPDTVRAPDVGVIRAERAPAEGLPRGYFDGAPDLAVEVVS